MSDVMFYKHLWVANLLNCDAIEPTTQILIKIDGRFTQNTLAF